MSRPEIPINWDKVDELLMAGCHGTEVAAVLGINEETFYDRVVKKFNIGFSEYKAKKQSTGDSLLKLQQYGKAMGLTTKGDNTLLIYLGKVRLGQNEHPEQKVASDEIIKAYSSLMQQLSQAQASSSKPVLPLDKEESNSVSSPSACPSNAIHPYKESAFL